MNNTARIARLEKAVADPDGPEAAELRREKALRDALSDTPKRAADDRGDAHNPVTRRG